MFFRIQLGQGLVVVALVDGGQTPHLGQFRPRGQGRALGAIEHPLVHVLQPLVGVAEVVPDAGPVGHDVGGLAAVEDHVVHAMGEVQMLAEVVRRRRS